MTDDSGSKQPPDPGRRQVLRDVAGGTVGGLAAFALRSAYAAEPEEPGAPAAASTSRARPAGSTVDLAKKGMQLVITGSGSALPDPQRGGASCAVVVDGEILQFDCGRMVLENLLLVGISPARIDNMFLTHFHFDHIAEYDYYQMVTWIAGRRKPVGVFGPKGMRQMSDGALKHMHKMDYDVFKYVVEHWPADDMTHRPALEPPLQVNDVGPGVILETDRYTVTCVQTEHLPDPAYRKDSLGYRVDTKYGSVVISGDTRVCDNIRNLSKDVDILVHECAVPDLGMTHGGKFSLKGFHNKELKGRRPQTGHTSPTPLGKLAKEANVRKLIATHLAPYTSVTAAIELSSLYYGPSPGPEIWGKYINAIAKNYKGPIILAEDCMIFVIGE